MNQIETYLIKHIFICDKPFFSPEKLLFSAVMDSNGKLKHVFQNFFFTLILNMLGQKASLYLNLNHLKCFTSFSTHTFLSWLKNVSLLPDHFRQYSWHRGTQEYFHTQGSNPVLPTCGCGGQWLSGSVQHQHFDHRRVQLSACRPLSHRRGGGPRSDYERQRANLVRGSNLSGYSHR